MPNNDAYLIGSTLTIDGGEDLPTYEGVIDDDSEEFSINDYLKAAVASQHLSSERELCKSLGVSHSAVSNWRTGRAWPADETMRHLARLADGDPDEALLRLNMWRAKTPATKSVYRHMLNGIYRLKGSDYWPSLYKIPAIILVGTFAAQGNALVAYTVYYGKLYVRKLKQAIRQFLSCFFNVVSRAKPIQYCT